MIEYVQNIYFGFVIRIDNYIDVNTFLIFLNYV